MAEPKWVIAMGACVSSGGRFHNYAIVQGIDHVVPVDTYLPSCPPRPEMLIDSYLKLHELIRAGAPFGADRARIRREVEIAALAAPSLRSSRWPAAWPNTAAGWLDTDDSARPAGHARRRAAAEAKPPRRSARGEVGEVELGIVPADPPRAPAGDRRTPVPRSTARRIVVPSCRKDSSTLPSASVLTLPPSRRHAPGATARPEVSASVS